MPGKATSDIAKLGYKIAVIPTLTPALLIELLPRDIFRVKVHTEHIDGGFRPSPQDNPDLVVIAGVRTFAAPAAYDIGDYFLKRGIPVVIGGIHPSVLPEEAGAHSTSVVIGEGEGVWPRVIRDFLEDNLQPSYCGFPCGPLVISREARDVAYHLRYSRGNRGLILETIQITKGCPHGCEFCSVSEFSGRTTRRKPIDEAIEELKTLGKLIIFVDDNPFTCREYAEEFLARMAPLRKLWFSQISVKTAQDKQLLRLAARAGCKCLACGIESVETQQSKGGNFSVRNYKEAISNIHEAGIWPAGTFIFGFDGEGPGIFQRTLEFCRETKLLFAGFHILTPYPGTSLHRRLDSEGRILTSDWSQYTTREVVYQPIGMSAKELREGFQRSCRNFYAIAPSLQRTRSLPILLGNLFLSLRFWREFQ